MLLEIALGSLALTLAVYWYMTRNFGYWKRLGVPHDTAVPFFGSRKDVLLMRSHEGVDTDRIYRKFPDERYVGLYEGDQPVLLVRDAALVRQFFAKESEMPLSRRLLQDESSPFSDSLLFAHGVRWKRSRVLMSPFFTTARVKRGLATFLGNVDEVKRSLMGGDGAVLDVGDVFARYSIDNMAALIFGLDVSSIRDPDHEFRRLFVSVLGPGVANQLRRLLGLLFRSLLPVKYNFPGIEVSRYMDKTVDRLAETTGDDLIHTLLKLRGREIVSGDDGERTKPLVMTKELVGANAFMTFIAGTDTSASVIAFSLLELALNHEIQRTLYEEIQEKTEQRREQEQHLQQDDNNDDDAGGLTYETLKEMKYLGMIISETLRKWSPAVAVGRVTTAKTVFPGTNLTLEPGTGILIPIWSLQNDPKYFPDPERFDPERFSEEGKAQIVPGSYLPFADGGHICIGMHIGLLQVKAAVASIVKDYRVDTCEKTHIPVKKDPTAFITSQLGGTWLKFTRRSTQ